MEGEVEWIYRGDPQEGQSAPLVQFTNGKLKNPENMNFTLYRNKDINNPRKKNYTILNAETDRLSYVGNNFGAGALKCNTLCRYFVGVLDEPSGQMEVYNAELFNMQPLISGFQHPLNYQGYGYQEFQQHRQPFPVQAQVTRMSQVPPIPPMPQTPQTPPMPQVPLMPMPLMPQMFPRTPQTPHLIQLHTRQPHYTPSSTPQPNPASEHLSSVLCLTSQVLDEGPLNLTGLSQLSESFLNTPPPVVLSGPGTPMAPQTTTPATATSTVPGPFTPKTMDMPQSD